jgi:hypothetical protein
MRQLETPDVIEVVDLENTKIKEEICRHNPV